MIQSETSQTILIKTGFQYSLTNWVQCKLSDVVSERKLACQSQKFHINVGTHAVDKLPNVNNWKIYAKYLQNTSLVIESNDKRFRFELKNRIEIGEAHAFYHIYRNLLNVFFLKVKKKK